MPISLALSAALGVAVLQPPQTVPDPIGDLIKATKLTYTEITKFYQLSYIIDEKRKQTIYVRKETYDYRSLKVNEVYSLVWESPNAMPADQLLTTFLTRLGIGGLIYEQPSEAQKLYRIRFRMTVPISLSPDAAKEYFNTVAVTGDTLEAKLNPGAEDKF
jgi:hypothetical protein